MVLKEKFLNVYVFILLLMFLGSMTNKKINSKNLKNQVGTTWSNWWRMKAENNKVKIYNTEEECLRDCEGRNECYLVTEWNDTMIFLNNNHTTERYFCLIYREPSKIQGTTTKLSVYNGYSAQVPRFTFWFYRDLCNSYCQATKDKLCDSHVRTVSYIFSETWYKCE